MTHRGWLEARPPGRRGGVEVRRARLKPSARQVRSHPKGRFRRETALFAAVTAIAWAAAFGITTPGPVTASARSRVAVADQWTPTTQVFDNGDGTSAADVYAAPIQAPDPTSATGWSPIDTTLHSTADGLAPSLTDASVQFSAGDQADPLATVGQDGTSLSVDWTGDASAPTMEGDT